MTKIIKFLLFNCIRNLLKTAVIFNFIKYLHFMTLTKGFSIKKSNIDFLNDDVEFTIIDVETKIFIKLCNEKYRRDIKNNIETNKFLLEILF